MKTDKIPTSRCRLNWLSRESADVLSESERSSKKGDPERSSKRVEQWARWMFETRSASAIPENAALVGCGAPGHFDEYLFVLETEIPGWFERVNGVAVWHPPALVRQPITEPFVIPMWCQPVLDAERWHRWHQTTTTATSSHRRASTALSALSVPSVASHRTTHSHELLPASLPPSGGPPSHQTTYARSEVQPCAPSPSIVWLDAYRPRKPT